MQALLIFWAMSLFTPSLPQHDFHSSICHMEYKSEARQLQIYIKVFSDDLEAAVGGKLEREKVGRYIKSVFSIQLDGKAQKLNYLGYERESELTYVYLELSNLEDWNSLTVKSLLFHELFNDQVNLVFFKWRGQEISVVLDDDTTLHRFSNEP